MKKILAILLTLCFVLSAFTGTVMTASAEEVVEDVTTEDSTSGETSTEEPTEITPAFTIYTKYGGKTAYITPKDNSVVTKAVQVNSQIAKSDYVLVQRENDSSVYSVQGVIDWLKDEDAQLRLWVRMPWIEGNPTINLSIDLYMEYAISGSTKYPHTYQYVKLAADGLWHEVRMNASEFDNLKAFDAGIKDPENTTFKNVNIRLKTYTATEIIPSEKLAISTVEFYSAPLTTEVNDGNIAREYFNINSSSKGADKAIADYVTISKGGIAGNKYIQSGAKIIAKSDNAFKSGNRFFPYSKTLSIAEGETYNQLHSWISNDGAEMRTYVRNGSDTEISFYVGFYAVVKYNGSTIYPQIHSEEAVTLPANSDWVELRYTADDFAFYTDLINKFTLSTGYVTLSIKAANTNFLKAAGDTLYVTPLEVCNMDILEEPTNPNKDFNRSAVFNDDYSWGSSSEFTRTYADCADLPYFQKAITFTANDTYTGAAGRLNVVVDNHVIADNFADWAFNPKAQLRFWVKSTEDRTFKLTLQQNNKDIYTNITVTGSEDWQEVVLKRSDFSANSEFDSALITNIADTDMDVYCFINTTENNFQISESLMFGGIMEVFSAKAYAKGDANRDDMVNLKDLVRTKKLIATWGTDIYTADIDNTRALNANDLVYLRNWIIKNAWN